MESKVEEYVLVPKRDGYISSLPSSSESTLPSPSKPSDSHAEIQSDKIKSPSTSDGSSNASVVVAAKKQTKPRKYNKRPSNLNSGVENKKLKKSNISDKNEPINISTDTSDLTSCENKDGDASAIKLKASKSCSDLKDCDQIEVQTSKARKSKSCQSLEEKSALLEGAWVKF